MKLRPPNLVLLVGPLTAVAVLVTWVIGYAAGASWTRGVRWFAVWRGAFSTSLLSPIYAILFYNYGNALLQRLDTWRMRWRFRRRRCPYCGHALDSADERCAGCGWREIHRSCDA